MGSRRKKREGGEKRLKDGGRGHQRHGQTETGRGQMKTCKRVSDE